MDKADISSLIEAVKAEVVSNKQQEEAPKFNVFDILGLQHKELPMCRMLAEWLNPAGAHRQGSGLLKLFCDKVLSEKGLGDDELDAAKIYTEYPISRQGRRVDIVIETPKRFIPIEVKIWAADQPGQLMDYYKFAQKKNENKGNPLCKIFYLTRDGHAPSKESIRSLQEGQYICISWRSDVYPFLSEVLKSKTLPQPAQIILEQYCDVVRQVSGALSQKVQEKMNKLLWSPGRIKAADTISAAVPRVKVELLKKLFQEIDKELHSQTYSHGEPIIMHIHRQEVKWESFQKQLEKYYDVSGTTWPGITMMLKQLKVSDDPAHQYFLGIRFEIGCWRPYVGITVARYDTKIGLYESWGIDLEKKDPFKNILRKEASKCAAVKDDGSMKGWWLTWHYIPGTGFSQKNPGDLVPNFKESNPAYYDLYSNEKRSQLVSEIVAGMMKYYNNLNWEEIGKLDTTFPEMIY